MRAKRAGGVLALICLMGVVAAGGCKQREEPTKQPAKESATPTAPEGEEDALKARRPLSKAERILAHQAMIAAEKARDLLPKGGKTVLICREGRMDEVLVAAFEEAGEGSKLDVVVYRSRLDLPDGDPEALDPMMMSPEIEGIKAMMEALKQHKDAKLVVSFLGLSLGMIGPEPKLPEDISTFFDRGGKAVIVGTGSIMMDPAEQDPLLGYVAKGDVVLIAPQPAAKLDPQRNPLELEPSEYFDTFMMIVDKQSLSEYKKQLEKVLRGPQ